ncbi:VCBS domain-containing protein, partial [Photobacterium chitinilyticum]|uniref:VCBS domain-containing protein n=1 Tax=Photobacterium chitinilyticum TaxID=2485123 RepID=UPI003D0FD636
MVDPDAGEAVFAAETVTDGNFGTFKIGTDGTWSYELNNGSAEVQALTEASDPLNREFTVTTADGTEHTVTVTINGSDDGAVVTPTTPDADAGSVKEDAVLTTGGKLDVVDPDAGEAVFDAETVTDGNFGTFTIGTDGTWSYELNNGSAEVQALTEASEPLNREFTVTTADGTEHTVTVTINGSDDGAVVTPTTPDADAGTVKEDAVLTTGGKLDVVDPDAGEAVFAAETVTDGNYGTFKIGTDGTWSYELNNGSAEVQALTEETEPLSREFTVTTADGTEHTVTVTINGSDDGAVVTPSTPDADAGTVKEDTILTTGGKLDVADPDAGEAVFEAKTVTDGNYGTFKIGTDGTWSYELNNGSAEVQALTEETEPLSREFTVTTADGTEHTVTVTINGSDDGAVITPSTPDADAGTVKEDTVLTTGGKLDVVDPDAGEAVFEAETVTDGNYGTFKIGTDGTWSYELNNGSAEVQALTEASEPLNREFTVTTADGTEHTVTVTINGSDDGAVVTPAVPDADAGTVKED